MDFFDAGGILHGQRRDGRQAMTAQAGAGHGVRGQTVGARGIERTEDQNERGSNGGHVDSARVRVPGLICGESGEPLLGFGKIVPILMDASRLCPVAGTTAGN